MLGIVTSEQPAVLTEKLRLQLYLLNTVGPVAIVGEGLGAALDQWRNVPKEWGQGAGAYGKRIGSNLAYNGIRQTITYASSAALHEDNRYFVSEEKDTWARTRYALASTVMARKPDGHRSFSYSAVSGVAAASLLSSTWGPAKLEGTGECRQGCRDLSGNERGIQHHSGVSSGHATSRSQPFPALN